MLQTIDNPQSFQYVFMHVLTAGLLGAAIGFERGLARKDASIRTFSLVSIGSCIFTLLSLHSTSGFNGPDPSRIAAQVVSGIGFLGAGVIFRSSTGVRGLTTAALLWVTASIGMSVGFDRMDLAYSGTIVSIFIVFVIRMFYKFRRGKRKNKTIQAQTN